MATKSKANRRKLTYEFVTKNIGKMTSPAGTVSYRVRVQANGQKMSGTASSLKAAKQLRAEFIG